MFPGRRVRSTVTAGDAVGRSGLLQRVPLRLLVLSITVPVILLFATVALLNHHAAPIALLGAILVALNALVWLAVLKRARIRLRRHGYRW